MDVRKKKLQTFCSFVQHQPEVSLTSRWSKAEAQILRRANFFLQDVSTLERVTRGESKNQWIILNHLPKLILLLSEVNNLFLPFPLFICFWFLRCDVVFHWFGLFCSIYHPLIFLLLLIFLSSSINFILLSLYSVILPVLSLLILLLYLLLLVCQSTLQTVFKFAIWIKIIIIIIIYYKPVIQQLFKQYLCFWLHR